MSDQEELVADEALDLENQDGDGELGDELNTDQPTENNDEIGLLENDEEETKDEEKEDNLMLDNGEDGELEDNILDTGETLPEDNLDEAPNDQPKWIQIQNLTRPFSTAGLKSHIKSLGGEFFGEKQDDHFWINSIKSCAFIRLENHSEVGADIVSKLDGTNWPEANPKTLLANIRSQSEKDNFAKNGDIKEKKPQDKKRRNASEKTDGAGLDLGISNGEQSDEGGKTGERKKKRRRRSSFSRSRSPSADRSDDSRAGTPPPVVTEGELDKLFNKTKTMPQIYWRKLTEEEADKKNPRKD